MLSNEVDDAVQECHDAEEKIITDVMTRTLNIKHINIDIE